MPDKIKYQELIIRILQAVINENFFIMTNELFKTKFKFTGTKIQCSIVYRRILLENYMYHDNIV